MLAQGRRGELAREIDSGHLERRLRNGHRPDRGRRWALWLRHEIEAPIGTPAPPKIRCLHDASAPART